jgi:hypothetical protein
MYSRDLQAPEPPAPIQTLEASELDGKSSSRSGAARDAYGNVRRGNAAAGAADRMAAAAGRESRSGLAEMNALAGLIRAPTSASGHTSAGASDEDTFKLNLFGDPAGGSASGGGGGGGGGSGGASVLEFRGDAGTGNKASGLTDVMKSFGVEKSPAGASKKSAFDDDASGSESEDDLLALMDGA